jgi:large subunit ribosomal protein L28
MARRCQISGTTHQNGHRVSHANNKTKHRFESNLQSKKLYVDQLGKYVRVKVSTRMLRTIDKVGLVQALKQHNMTLKDVA